MNVQHAVSDLGLGLISGLVGTRAMGSVSELIYEHQSPAIRAREAAVQPGPANRVAAEKLTGAVGLHLEGRKLDLATEALHYGVGLAGGTLYTLLRRRTRLAPLATGALVGFTVWLLVDEGLNPVLGFSAPAPAYPIQTHGRGLLAHTVFGFAVAGTAEALAALGRRAFGRRWARRWLGA
jgi:uncharacterized membrane protein YagU involved in acid resistance